MGHEAIWCQPRTSLPDDTRRGYPKLPRQLKIQRPSRVWCADITHVAMPHGQAYLCAVMDWHSRKVLGPELSNILAARLCLRALNQAIAHSGRTPEIFNPDQGCPFTAADWLERLTELEVKISMDRRRRWLDNVFIERLWRSVKYEDLYLHEYATLPALAAGLVRWFERYNAWRPHQALGNLTPEEVLPIVVRGAARRRWSPKTGGSMKSLEPHNSAPELPSRMDYTLPHIATIAYSQLRVAGFSGPPHLLAWRFASGGTNSLASKVSFVQPARRLTNRSTGVAVGRGI